MPLEEYSLKRSLDQATAWPYITYKFHAALVNLMELFALINLWFEIVLQ